VAQSQSREGKVFTKVGDLNASLADTTVLIRGRVHSSRAKGNLCFLVIRQRMHSVQVVISKGDKVSKAMVNFAASISSESIVDVEGKVVASKVEATTQKDVEINVNKLFVVSASAPLPLVLEDLSRPQPILQAQVSDS
jgi:aspartyl-tRNA synthetase